MARAAGQDRWTLQPTHPAQPCCLPTIWLEKHQPRAELGGKLPAQACLPLLFWVTSFIREFYGSGEKMDDSMLKENWQKNCHYWSVLHFISNLEKANHVPIILIPELGRHPKLPNRRGSKQLKFWGRKRNLLLLTWSRRFALLGQPDLLLDGAVILLPTARYSR